ncbi:DNA replication protein DnaD [Erysipelothrix larvae]|uniref:DNA replication protein DnaD n=1 Tax=Erysipelothrix larvae TaxID=1514105 RepID=A0A120JU17_9FIRM|nr:DnaD domain protein [Erysipelothrix larvae]AMC94636.1 DNA replication protein DnaD [Erysipelothrix larvae]
MWWNRPYVNRRDWILENLKTLKLSAKQTVLLLMIDYMNGQNETIDLNSLNVRTGLEVSEIDMILHDLQRSKLLVVKPSKDRIVFSIDPLFEEGVRYEYMDETIYEVFESELGRLLSQPELEMLNTWLSKYTQDEILDALRSAIVVQKVSMKYINAILINKRDAQ